MKSRVEVGVDDYGDALYQTPYGMARPRQRRSYRLTAARNP